MSSRKLFGSPALAAVALAGLLAVGAGRWQSAAVSQEKAPPVKPAQLHQAEQLSAAFRHAAEVAMHSVVTVHSKVKPHAVKHTKGNPHSRPNGNEADPSNGENPFKGTPFEDFFGGEFRAIPGNPSPHSRAREGVGSGVIVDPSGIILTNNHVVEGADEVIVELADGREFKADNVKTDPAADLAVIRIKGAGSLPAATLGDSDQMQIGDWVLAIGNPFELEQTVSAGIISGKGRDLEKTRARMLQTDAAINPGNSGGPLVNLEGEVIGINTAIATNNGAFQGVGFVIPSNLAKWVMHQLINKGSVERAYLGIVPSEVDREVAAHVVHARRGEGAIIADVTADSPAEEAGLQTGDIITEINGQKIHSPSELRELVERTEVGSNQKLTVLRDGKLVAIDVVPKAMPKDPLARKEKPEVTKGNQEMPEAFAQDDLGLTVGELSAEGAQAFQMKEPKGVLITQVDPNGPAAQKGLKRGMVILSVDNHSLKSVEDFKAAMKGKSADGVLLLVRAPNSGNHYIELQGSVDNQEDSVD